MAAKSDRSTPSGNEFDRLRDKRAEEAALGSLILDPARVAPILARVVTAADFFDAELGKLVAAAIELHQAGRAISDPIVLMGAWRALGLPFTEPNILRIANDVPHAGHALYYGERIRDLARLRKLVAMASQLRSRAVNGDEDCEDILGWLDAQSLALRHNSGDDQAELIGDVMQRVVSDYEAKRKAGQKPVLLSGFPAADERGFVFAPGEMTVLAARTSMGKTTFATQIGMYHAGKNRQVLMASLEMKSTEVAGRLLASSSGNNHQLLRTHGPDEIALRELRETADAVGKIPLRIWSPGRVKAGRIHAMASLSKASHGLDLLIVDLLNVVLPDDRTRDQHEQLGQITKSIRDIAQQLQVPVLLVAQLNRGAEGERPRLNHLKGSGSIEEDADIVALLHGDGRARENVELIVEKNRFGAPGSVPLKFVASQTRFADPSVEIEHHRNYEPSFANY